MRYILLGLIHSFYLEFVGLFLVSPALWDSVIFQACQTVTVFHHTHQTGHTDLALCSIQQSSWDVGVSVMCSAWTGVQYQHCTIKHHFWFGELITLLPLHSFHITRVFAWIDFGHFSLNWSCNKCVRKQ